ncbi:MAG TPA: LapA family protein [Rhizobacter sp.]|nr:LapA family protein [Rhizobacter sp.]
MRIFVWLVRIALFFALFAFALNNQHQASIKWFFSREWQAPMVFIVLAAFALGCVFGVLAMVPSWWQHRRLAHRQREALTQHDPDAAASPSTSLTLDTHPPRNEF